MSFSLNDLSAAVSQLVDGAAASVVRVDGRHHRGASGVFFAADGVIVTANHAVHRDESIHVTRADGGELEATLVGRDPGTDLAVLRVAVNDAQPIAWTDAADLRVGSVTVTVARPGRTVRAAVGYIGARGDEVRTPFGGRVERYLEIDRPLPPGFSGGVALDSTGHAVGLATSGLFRGSPVIVPASTLRRVVSELLARGRVARGYLGVSAHPVRFNEDDAVTYGQRAGVLIAAIERESPAARGGLHLGDLLLTVEGHPIAHPADLLAVLSDKANTEITLKIVRGGNLEERKLTAGERA